MQRFTLLLLALTVALGACETSGLTDEPLSVEARSALEVLPPDAQVVAAVDVKQLADNPELSMASLMNSLGAVHDEARARVNDFIEATGFDPVSDLSSVFVASSEDREPIVLAYAAYDVDRVSEFIDAKQASVLSKDFYREIPIYELSGDESSMFLALAGQSMLIAATDRSELTAVLDRALDTANRSVPAELAELVGRVAGNDSWVVVTRVPTPPADKSSSELAGIVASVASISAGVDASTDRMEMTTWLTPRSDVSAGDLEDLVRGGIAALKLQAQDNPLAFDVLDRVDTRTSGGALRIRAEVTNEQFASLKRDQI